MQTAIPMLPVELRQIEQWHTNISDSALYISKETAPQLHFPFGITLYSDFTPNAKRTGGEAVGLRALLNDSLARNQTPCLPYGLKAPV